MKENLNPNQNNEINEMLNNEKLANEQKAREYLNGKPRAKRYFVSGHSASNDDDGPGCYTYIPFSDKEVARIRELLVTTYNEAVGNEKITSPSEIPADFNLWVELEEQNEELDELLFNRGEKEHDILIEELDIINPHYLYNMTMIPYDEEQGKFLKGGKFEVELTDDEYVYLLSSQIRGGYCFNYNRLIAEAPKLAAKIDDTARRSFGDIDILMPFLILMDEVREDAKKIAGREYLN